MKNWFLNLRVQVKIFIHFLMFLFILIVFPMLISVNNVFLFLWLFALVIEIIFIIWSIKSLKYHKEKNNKTIENNSEKIENDSKEIETNSIETENKKVDTISETKNLNESNNITKKVNKTESDFDLDKIILDYDCDYKLKYEYKENLCFCENFNSFGLADEVELKREKENDFDKDSVAVYSGGLKIGYLFKGTCRDIVLNCLDNEKYLFNAFVYKRDVENKKIGLKIGFYTPFNKNEIIIGSIGKTSKIDPLTDEKRQEQVECLSENDKVTLEKIFDEDELLVSSDSGYELGELSKSVSDKILKNIDDLSNAEAYISSVELIDGKIKAKIKIFIN